MSTADTQHVDEKFAETNPSVTSSNYGTFFLEPKSYEILIAVFVILLSIVPVIIFFKRARAPRGVLMLGLCDSGKTLLFSRLFHGKFVKTHTSVKENKAEYRTDNVILDVVDIPGHERLRMKYFDDYKAQCRGLVYVIDSSSFQKNIRDVAEFFYTLLTDNVIYSLLPPILVICNKQDEITAKGIPVISQMLQSELNTLRITKANQLEGMDGKKSKCNILGKEGQDLDLSKLPYKIKFVECAALNEDEDKPADIEAFETWLHTL